MKTGIFDSNKKEICVGDIVKVTFEDGESIAHPVTYEYGEFYMGEFMLDELKRYQLEIIGTYAKSG